MALPLWTLTQVVDQLDTGQYWFNPTITYAFPTSADGMYVTGGEDQAFLAVNGAQATVLALALKTWDDLIPQQFQQTTSSASNIEFAYSGHMAGNAYAYAYLPTNGSVWFSSSAAFNQGTGNLLAPVVGRYGFMTFLHEIGHALGLNHMGDYDASAPGGVHPYSFQDSHVYSVMSYFGPNVANFGSEVQNAVWSGYEPQTPMLYDVWAVQQMYGTSATTRTDDTVYGFGGNVTGMSASVYDFTLNQHPILTIFDSGGVDTLNLSGWSTPSTVYLEPGVYSSVNGMTNNIVIAYTTVIEAVIGGNGADTLVGNSVANQLSGGLGNDRLAGGAGSDLLSGGAGADTFADAAANLNLDQITDFSLQDFIDVTDVRFTDLRYTPGDGLLALDVLGNHSFSTVVTLATGLAGEFVATGSPSGQAPATQVRLMLDTDGDGVGDFRDNAVLVPNANQRDTDNDGYGNIVDADFNQSGRVDFADLSIFQSKFFSKDPHADLNGDGIVNFADLSLVQGLFFKPPGQSYIDNAGAVLQASTELQLIGTPTSPSTGLTV